jgi:hypothetical protein
MRDVNPEDIDRAMAFLLVATFLFAAWEDQPILTSVVIVWWVWDFFCNLTSNRKEGCDK